MCSGTESPLLALGMFSKAIKERGLGHLEIEHVFSCEIEPYKQAYIERNFKPPILFRDIKELGGDVA
jgi:site-specific DNA-cytosine methylase